MIDGLGDNGIERVVWSGICGGEDRADLGCVGHPCPRPCTVWWSIDSDVNKSSCLDVIPLVVAAEISGASSSFSMTIPLGR